MKTIRTAFILVALASFALLPLVGAAPDKHQFKQLRLKYTTTDPEDPNTTPVWKNMPGNEISAFKLDLDPSVPYYYLDIKTVTLFSPLANDFYGFTLDYEHLPVDSATWETFWAGKGALNGGADWQQLLYDIAHGTKPIFYFLHVVGDKGTTDRLIDGFLYQYLGYGAQYHTLRVDGSYPLGTYVYNGTAALPVTMQITFK